MRQVGIPVECSLSIESICKPCYLTSVCGSFCPLHPHCKDLSRGIIVHSCGKHIVGGIGPVEFLQPLKKGDAWWSGGRKNVRCFGRVRRCSFDSSPPCTRDTLDRSFHPHHPSHPRVLPSKTHGFSPTLPSHAPHELIQTAPSFPSCCQRSPPPSLWLWVGMGCEPFVEMDHRFVSPKGRDGVDDAHLCFCHVGSTCAHVAPSSSEEGEGRTVRRWSGRTDASTRGTRRFDMEGRRCFGRETWRTVETSVVGGVDGRHDGTRGTLVDGSDAISRGKDDERRIRTTVERAGP